MKKSNLRQRTIFISLGIFFLSSLAAGANDIVEFDSGFWQLGPSSRIEEFLGRKALTLTGTVFLKDVEFENGIVEVDVACKEGRYFPSIVFHRQDGANYEEFYVRPHKSGQPDALQYTPVINGLSAWQLYYGEGYTNTWIIPKDEWIHIKLEISGDQARVFVGDIDSPSLVIDDLKLGRTRGGLGLKVTGPIGLAYFSDFKFSPDDSLSFLPPTKIETPLGMLTQWQVSQSFPFNRLDRKVYPTQDIMNQAVWTNVTSEATGLVNVSRYAQKGPVVPGYVLARTTILADAEKSMELQFGYSDQISLFCNGKLFFHGSNVFQSRDPFFQGRVGLFDSVYLPLKEGHNELLLLLAESMGGWGFMCRDGDAIYVNESLAKIWEMASEWSYPETVLYDRDRDVLYISNLYTDSTQFISKVKMNGDIENREWITGLNQPTGMTLVEDRLFVVERATLAEIDLTSGKIIKRHPVPAPGFLNDIASDQAGNLYVSDSQAGRILTFRDGEFSIWKSGDGFAQVNGLQCSGGKLYAGFSSDASLKEIDLNSGEVRTVTRLDPGAIVDGIEMGPDGTILVSDFNGKVYSVSSEGQKTLLLDRTAQKHYCANFSFVPEKNLIVIPSLNDNRITIYRWEAK